ncbi:MAG: hypothetical protein ABIJ37_08325 [Pseudomonadota bacterium]
MRVVIRYCNKLNEKSIVGTLLSGAFDVYHVIIHGCSPVDDRYHKMIKI